MSFDYDEGRRRFKSKELPPLLMDLADVREAGRKLLAIDEAGLLGAFERAYREALASRGSYHDGIRWHPHQPAEARVNADRIREMRQYSSIGTYYPVVGWLVTFLGIPEEQAEAAAVELQVETPRTVALRLIDEYHKQARTVLARQRAGRRIA